MNLKQLLCGSIFAFIGAPLGYAAAAIPLPEPEPEEFVRACDAYGKGYFYIPGTDTCLKIGGSLTNETDAGDNVYAQQYGDLRRKSYAVLTNANLAFATASATKWGALRTYLLLRSSWGGGGEVGNADEQSRGSLRMGYIQLGGLRVGLGNSAFYDWTGYSINSLNDDIINGANNRTLRTSYTWENTDKGLSAILSLEQGNNFDKAGMPRMLNYDDGRSNRGGYRWENGRWKFRKLSMQQHDYTPYVVSGLKYEQKWGSVAAVAGYDSFYSEWAAKIRADYNLTAKWAVFGIAGYKSMEDYYNLDTTYGKGGVKQVQKNGKTVNKIGLFRQVNSMYGDWGGHWALYAGASYTPSKTFNVNWQIAHSTNNVTSTALNFEKQLLPGLFITPEISFVSWNYNSRHSAHADKQNIDGESIVSLKHKNAAQGLVYLRRSF